ncbi:MAG: hypothetical protein ACREBF_01760 [Candidatus Micrarchaeales archaeon]
MLERFRKQKTQTTPHIAPEAIFAQILIHPNTSDKLSYEEISKLVAKIDNGGIARGALWYLTGSDSVYCEDLSRWIGKMTSFGYATDEEKVVLRPEGREVCMEIVARAKRETPDVVDKMHKFLDTVSIKRAL